MAEPRCGCARTGSGGVCVAGSSVVMAQLRLPFAERVVLVRNHRARRYILRVDPDGTARVTIPRWGSKREALQFAERHAAWIARERRACLERASANRVSSAGGHVLLHGVCVPVACQRSGRGMQVCLGEVEFEVARDTALPEAVRRGLRALAVTELPARLRELAVAHGLAVGRVSIRDQRTRWGSCGANGHITLNWRLVQMPPFVRDYVLIHELMHLHEPNHSRRFWRRVAAAYPRVREARAWLRCEGRRLWS
ncbi:MAG: DUF45 domain-containing protein [Luteitalea sp.]|nr:DUF45 domain-containing protein [Luteitalea sp.]